MKELYLCQNTLKITVKKAKQAINKEHYILKINKIPETKKFKKKKSISERQTF